MEIKEFIDSWLEATNSIDTKHYLDFFLPEAILDDPSVGEKFTGHSGIKYYFESYFIGYNTQTVLNELIVNKDNSA
ncbi:hypothetical protein [Flavobacterium beibuense]|uniref:Nuclear transport factor 2 family protein n=1 Tax=Flavobacterium beibuense TaxID=657326 RepID=A0A444W914_9FLAO|nr:hypothetical protein [Flavobacterium beibuense]RYJ42397.1 hypothetical protein NU09_2183 [Flavobacterium beibuense]